MKAERCDQVTIAPFRFKHQPIEGTVEADTFIGGTCPSDDSIGARPDRVRLPAFVINDRQGVLPAFSSVSGGMTYLCVLTSGGSRSVAIESMSCDLRWRGPPGPKTVRAPLRRDHAGLPVRVELGF